MTRFVILLTFVAASAACDRSKIDEDEYLEAGEEAVQPFKKSLKAALVEGLEEGPVNAISVCRVEAPQLAERASGPNVRVGRTSSKLRNPGNAPKPWMKPLLERYEQDPEGREPRVVVVDDETVGYVEPIYVQPLCVTCHGKNLSDELEAKLDELYPADEATGYEAGDLRGMFWVELARK